MNTPAHLLISIATLSRSSDRATAPGTAGLPKDNANAQSTFLIPATIGAVLPDAPMFVFYGIEKLILGSTESDIWSTRYFMPAWQDFFDLFNSIPIAIGFFTVAFAMKNRFGCILFLSVLLHCILDLPVHHDDGHRHLWPLSDWRFASPISYWDPAHFGIFVAAFEVVLSTFCFVVALRRHRRKLTRWLLCTLFVAYALMSVGYFSYVLLHRHGIEN